VSEQVQAGVAQVEEWAAELEGLCERIAPRFHRVEVRRRTGAFLRGLLAGVERKNSWQLAEQAGDHTPDGMQRLLNHARWDPDEVRDELRGYVVEHLGDPGAVLVIDETGFRKKGAKSAGVQRQYSGTAGRIENGQVGVFLASASRHGHALIDRELYLPESWLNDRPRCRAAAIPDAVGFHTKPQLAQGMLERAPEAEIPVAWVTGDEVYGGDGRLRRWLEERDVPHVLAVKRSQALWSMRLRQERAATLAGQVPAGAWRQLSAGTGPRAHGSTPGPGCRSGRFGSQAGDTGCWCVAASRTGSWRSLCAMGQPGRPWPSWSRWRGALDGGVQLPAGQG
jgi:SRSO17 transposase